MLDIKLLRENLARVKERMATRGTVVDWDEFVLLDRERREALSNLERLKEKKNRLSGEIGKVKKSGGDAASLMREVEEISEAIKNGEGPLAEIEARFEKFMLMVPNLPHPSVSLGKGSKDNKEVRRWGEPPKFDFPAKNHWDVGEELGILDFTRAAKLAGARFALYKGAGARLERALINFMLDMHTQERAYQEVLPPFLVNRDVMMGTGQLPKFEEDAYRTEPDDLFLVPTAEVPVTNLHRDEILDGAILPRGYVSYTPCFRREAGAAGKDTRGLLRVHQFDKVELVRFCRPADSPAEHEKMTGDAEDVLRRLELPYRVLLMAIGDLGFAAAKKYDLEVWAPGVGQWLEVSSSSSFTDYQARRANIRCRPKPGDKPEFVHTLNASGVAPPRTIAALLETRQQPDGSVTIPAALVPYLGTDRLVPPGGG